MLTIQSLLAIHHVQQDLPNLMGREPEEILNGLWFGFIQRRQQPHPGFMDDAVNIMVYLKRRKGLPEHFSRQSPETVHGVLKQLTPHLVPPFRKPIDEFLEYDAGIVGHVAKPENERNESRSWRLKSRTEFYKILAIHGIEVHSANQALREGIGDENVKIGRSE